MRHSLTILVFIPFLLNFGDAKQVLRANTLNNGGLSLDAHLSTKLQTGWTAQQSFNALKRDIDNLGSKYPGLGPVVIQAGAAVMAWGCRPHNALNDADLWLAPGHSRAFMEAFNLNKYGGKLIPGGAEWGAGSPEMGNVHELDVRDGQKSWGNFGILNIPETYWMDTGVTTASEIPIYILTCQGLLKQKLALHAETPCQRAHFKYVDCNSIMPPAGVAQQMRKEAIAQGQAKLLQDGKDISCIRNLIDAGSCNQYDF